VRLDMTPVDAPVAIAGEVLDALRSADGAITGFPCATAIESNASTPTFANPGRTLHSLHV
jgi:hypothetical protein